LVEVDDFQLKNDSCHICFLVLFLLSLLGCGAIDNIALRCFPRDCTARTCSQFLPGHSQHGSFNASGFINKNVSQAPFVHPPYRREASMSGTPRYKKQPGVFLQIFNILRKKVKVNFKINGIG
jgi:hypothetical protein